MISGRYSQAVGGIQGGGKPRPYYTRCGLRGAFVYSRGTPCGCPGLRGCPARAGALARAVALALKVRANRGIPLRGSYLANDLKFDARQFGFVCIADGMFTVRHFKICRHSTQFR